MGAYGTRSPACARSDGQCRSHLRLARLSPGSFQSPAEGEESGDAPAPGPTEDALEMLCGIS